MGIAWWLFWCQKLTHIFLFDFSPTPQTRKNPFLRPRLCLHTPVKMFVTKKNRILVYQYLFREGTLVAKKDPYQEKHSDALPIPNLEVMKLLQSFKSKGFVKETFNWQYYYYYLTNEGITYLREYLALPADIVPATLKQTTLGRPTTSGREERPDRGDRGDYKKGGPGGDFKPEFSRGDRGEGRREYRPREDRPRA